MSILEDVRWREFRWWSINRKNTLYFTYWELYSTIFAKILYLRVLEAFLRMHKLGTYKNIMLIRTMGNSTSVLLTLYAVTVKKAGKTPYGHFVVSLGYSFGSCGLTQNISLVVKDRYGLLQIANGLLRIFFDLCGLLWVALGRSESLWVLQCLSKYVVAGNKE